MKNFIIWAILISAASYGLAKLYLHNKVGKAMDTAVIMMSPYADIEYEGVASTLSGELTIDGVRVRIDGFRDSLTIDRIGIDTPSFLSLVDLGDLAKTRGESMPDSIGFLMEGLRIPANADYYQTLYDFALQAQGVDDASSPANECTGKYGFSPKALNALGYRDQVVSFAMTVRDDETRYSFDMQVSMDEMWDMDARVSLAGNIATEMSKGLMYRPKLRDMRVEFKDRSLVNRVAKYCGQRGLSEEETLTAQLDSFKFVGESNGIEFDEYMLDPYMEFLRGKSTLVVTAQPSEPIAFSQIDLYKPSDVPALLNLAAVAQ